MDKFPVLIIDDERSARQELKRAIAAYPELELVGEAGNADDAEEMIRKFRPVLLFLDIRMPGRSGFELLEALDDVPQVIFVTAFDQYALQAFEFNAFDYLLKPFRDERFKKAIRKFLDSQSGAPAAKRLFIRDGKRCYFLQLAEVHLIDSMDNYARLYFKGQRAIIKSSLNQLEEKLGPNLFFRANRTQLMNTTFIKKIERLPGGKLAVTLTTGDRLEFSERQSFKFKQQNGF